jgi:polygalacturonase
MPTKISQLKAATDVTASDLIQVIDIEDTGMAVSGTNKKCTAQLMANELGKLTNITATGSTTARTLANRFADVFNVKDFGAIGDGVTDDTNAIQAAVNACIAKKGKLIIPSGIYNVKWIQIDSYISIYGDGARSSILRQTAIGNAIFYNYTANSKFNIYVDSICFDVNYKDSGITVKNVTSLTVKNCDFLNNPAWGIHVGIEEARVNTTTKTCEDILIENCRFNNTTSTFEHILLFNGRNMVVRDCEFIGAKTGGIGIGLYQNLTDVTISGCSFKSITKGLYYSITTNNITITDSVFNDCQIGIQGANESDHGLFGELWTYGLYIDTCRFVNNLWAVEIGSVRGGAITNCQFDRNIDNTLVFSYGNRLSTPTIQQPVNILVQGCNFINNNQSGILHSLHPAILFNEGGGAFFLTVVGCNFEDSQLTPTQRFAVCFNGAFNWSGIRFFGGRLASYSGTDSIAVINSATLSDIKLYGCMDVSATLPSGVTIA